MIRRTERMAVVGWSRVKGITFSWAVIEGQAGGRPWSSGATGKL
jgi:hypothetical protein